MPSDVDGLSSPIRPVECRETGKPRSPVRGLRVALVQMPFTITAWPSLGLSLLKAIVAEAGHEVRIFYFNQAFQDEVGVDIYAKLARGAPQNVDLLGEWLFSEALFGRDSSVDAAYLEDVFEGRHPAHRKPPGVAILDEMRPHLTALRAKATNFIEMLEERGDWDDYDVVGFTSTFQQHVASLALAKRLKARRPNIKIVFGGANCEADMGRAALRRFPFIDAVCLGEGDAALPDYLAALARDEAGSVAGILTRSGAYAAAREVILNDLPYPDFEDFFTGAPVDDPNYAHEHRLIFESSRGCWWGQKNHCTFCGLNGGTMAFRRKDGARAIAEIRHLLDTYGRHTRNVTATDNIIPYEYFRTFLPDLAALSMDLSLFYETKANLRKDQVALYRAAGLTAIQPGIESLSTPVLKLMRKGVSALQNLQLLKWCSEYGIEAKWNFLAGFPGEAPEWYTGLPELVRKIRHLVPPVGVSTLRFDRFSPYHVSPAKFGLTALTPYPAYAYVYRDIPEPEVANLAYYFVTDYPEGEAGETYARDTFHELELWRERADEFALFHVDSEDGVLVLDLRTVEPRLYRLVDVYADVFLATDQITPLENFRNLPHIARAADTLIGLGLLIEENAKVLNVSVPATEALRLGDGAVSRLGPLLSKTDAAALTIHAAHVATYSAATTKEREACSNVSCQRIEEQENVHG